MPKDIFNFGCLIYRKECLPPLKSFQARDNEAITYRFYPTTHNRTTMILLHGSGSHGEYLHALARYLSKNNLCQVYVPNIRGHYLSGTTRGHCKYIGQLEDDIVDLINTFNLADTDIYLGGHSSGGALTLRFAGNNYGRNIKGFLLLSPTLPRTPILRHQTAGGWANVYWMRFVTLTLINYLKMSWLNYLTIINFNLPKRFQSNKATLSYSFNLYTSLHPRYPYTRDIDALTQRYLLLVGEQDEANNPYEYVKVFNKAPENIKILPNIQHLDIVVKEKVMDIIKEWMLTIQER